MRRIVITTMATLALGMAATGAQADERQVPQGFAYTPENTTMPPVNSPAYQVIIEADRREAEIATSKRLRADHDDWRVYNMEMDQQPPRNGWRRY